MIDECQVRMFGGSQGSRIHLCRKPLAWGSRRLCVKHQADRERMILADRARAIKRLAAR